MSKLNNKGYMLVEIILASVLAFGLAFFLLELTIKLKNKNDDLLVRTLVSTDQAIVMNTIMKEIEENFDNFECTDIEFIPVDEGTAFKLNDKTKSIITEFATVEYYANDINYCNIDYDNKVASINVDMDVIQFSDGDFDSKINFIKLDKPIKNSTITLLSNIPIDDGTKLPLNYAYTGGQQLFETPAKTDWLLKTWGAQGGAATTSSYGGSVDLRVSKSISGGSGGYSRGKVNTGDPMYINVGGAGTSGYAFAVMNGTLGVSTISGGYNGGGMARASEPSYTDWSSCTSYGESYYCPYMFIGSGGGATHIATQSGVLPDLVDAQDKVLIVSGGGGGSTMYHVIRYYANNSSIYDTEYGGDAGGYIGLTGYDYSYSGIGGRQDSDFANVGTYVSGGYELGICTSSNTNCASQKVNGETVKTKFGSGGSAIAGTSKHSGGGGGGGWYGGGGGKHSGSNIGAGGGGSGYIKGLSDAWMYGYDTYTSDAKDTKTYSITKSSSAALPNFPKSGNGYAIITTDIGAKNDVYYVDNIYYKTNTNNLKFTLGTSLDNTYTSLECDGATVTISSTTVTISNIDSDDVVCKLYYGPTGLGDDDLVVYYDGANKTGEQNSTSSNLTIWTNLASSGYNGILYDTSYGYWTSSANKNSYWNEGYGYGAGVLIDGSKNLLTDGSSFTLEAYIDPSGFSYDRDVISNWQSGGYGLMINTSGKLYFGIYNTSTKSYKGFYSSNTLSTTGKYLVTATWDNTSKNLCMYINGNPVSSTSTSVSNGCMSMQESYSNLDFSPSSGTPLAVGCNPNSSGYCETSSEEFYGYIHSARIYNRALSQSEIAYNYMVDSYKYGTS